jgi:hypothetical protein
MFAKTYLSEDIEDYLLQMAYGAIQCCSSFENNFQFL